MKKKILLLVFAAISFGGVSFAQNSGEINGKVYDASSGEIIIGANVYVELGETKIGGATDINGRFTVKPLPPGTYIVKVSFIGYTEKKIAGIQVYANQVTYLNDIKISEGGTTLGPIELSSGPPIGHKNPNLVQISSAKIHELPRTQNLNEIVATVGGGTYVSDDGQTLHVRGARPNSNSYYIDGVLVQDINSSMVPSNAIGSMQVYVGGVPARYGDVTGGVIAIETRTYFDDYYEAVYLNSLYEEAAKKKKEKEAAENKE